MKKKDYKITWIQLSKGDGGTSKVMNFKKSKGLPQSTVREQKNANKKLSKDKKGMDLMSKQSKTTKTVDQKTSQKRTSDHGGINIPNKTKINPSQSRIDDALARIDQQLEQREVDLTVGQTKDNETGQSEWGGLKGSDADPALIAYYNSIKRKINQEWVISKGDYTGTLVTKIVVMIDANGNILQSQYKKSSGDGSFDESAMRAIKRTAPFPVPPASIQSEALTEGFLIEFNPRSVTGSL